MSTEDFLVEIGTEELPPKALSTLGQSLADGIAEGLGANGLSWQSQQWLAAPRRLAVLLTGLSTQAADLEEEILGPPERVAFDQDGRLTRAGQAFAERHQLAPEQLQLKETPKGNRLVHRTNNKGALARDVLPGIIQQALEQLPIPRRMRWGALREQFVRPVHWVVLLLGDEVLPATILGVESGRSTRGHRFHHPGALTIEHPGDYATVLREEGRVIADFSERRALIAAAVEQRASALGAKALLDPALLDEVTALVEWPVVLEGRFEERFLAVPPEALISSMQEHQKYFPVVDGSGTLLPHFIFIANLESPEPEQIVQGNERVIRPRLADAAFFYETDLRTSLAERRERLKSIVFQNQLGSLWDKSQRVATLARFIAHQIGSDTELASRAGELAKADLVSEMVFEFPDLQGIAGYYYARNDGEQEELALAIREQYLPRFAGDVLPETATGCTLALADRLDTLLGIFGINQPPTGSRDPFALRRSVIGIIRIIREKAFTGIDLNDLIWEARVGFGDLLVNPSVVQDVSDFFFDRYRAMYGDEGVDTRAILAVQQVVQDNEHIAHNPCDIGLRIAAVEAFRQMPEAEALAVANKRVQNILAKQGGDGEAEPVKLSLLHSEHERELHRQLIGKAVEVPELCAARDYSGALGSLAELRPAVDAFFDHVMVMDPDEDLRRNRINLLRELNHLFLLIADVAQLQGGGGSVQ